MVQVQKRSLGSFKQDVFLVAGRLVNGTGALHHMGGQTLAVAQVFLDDSVSIQGLDAVNGFQQLVLFLERTFQTLPQALFVQQVDHTDPAAL